MTNLLSHAAMQDPKIPYVGTLDFDTRMNVLKRLAVHKGFELPNTIVPEGTALIPYGEAKKRKLQCEIDALPNFEEALAGVHAHTANAKPADVEDKANAFTMLESGKLIRAAAINGTGNAISYTPTAFSHLITEVKPKDRMLTGAAGTLLALTPAARAVAFNDFRSQMGTVSRDVLYRTVRTFDSTGRVTGRALRAVCSPRYSKCDDLDVMAALQSALPAGAKLKVQKGWDRTDVEVIWPALNRQLRAGDIALVSIRISNSETKGGAIHITPQLLRVLCLNFTTAYAKGVDETIIDTTGIWHIGDAKAKFAEAFARALAAVEPFVQAFGDAYATPIPHHFTRAEIGERIERKFELAKSTVRLALENWDADGTMSAGDTLAGLVNALTRASQQFSMEKAEKVEAVAGRLVLGGWKEIGL